MFTNRPGSAFFMGSAQRKVDIRPPAA